MKRALFVFSVVALGCAGTGTDTDNRAGLPDGTATRSQVLRGRYLVFTSGCPDCHNRGAANPYDPAWLAGWMPGAPVNVISFPPGPGAQPYRTYPANLTPDPATGIGAWTSQDIFNALRTGKDPNGVYLAPPMPWPDYRNMVDSDLWAIAAYLQSIKPVSNAVPSSEGPDSGNGLWADLYSRLPQAGLPPFPASNENDVQ